METEKVTPITLRQMKEKGEKHTFIPVYDYPFASILDESGIDAFLVGDSLGKQVLGRTDAVSVTVDEMIYHTQAVARATKRALIVTDMPFMSYEISIDEAKRNAGRIIKEGGANAVKIGGGMEIAETIAAVVKAGIPVMGQLSPPDQIVKCDMPSVRDMTDADRVTLVDDAKALEEAGAFMIGLVRVDAEIAREITQTLKIPTSGIGSGPYCDGTSLLLYHLIGLISGDLPSFVKKYANIRPVISDAVKQFIKESKDGTFPLRI
ncbi:3-methyl-2-oxobutanoate hydroxymethyltransferase [Chloroflexota bacterium]